MRSVFSGCGATRARRSRIPAAVFLEIQGESKISVHRLRVVPPDEATKIAVAINRNANFYGWAFLIVSSARDNEWKELASPLENNSYHADIVIPEAGVEDREE